MVATVSQLHGGNATYYVRSYYLGGEVEGEWLDTRAARYFELPEDEPVAGEAFLRLLKGVHPHRDEPLVQNAGDSSRQLGWDIQFGIDKSFSVLYAFLPEARGVLEDCLREAVRSAIIEVLEPQFLETRRGPGGKIREPVSSPVSMFLHRTNRENEIHLHCHVPVPNVGVRQDLSTGAIVSWNFYEAKMALGKAFHARLVELITERLGIACEFDELGLSRVKGFPSQVAAALSTPTKRITETAEDGSARAKEEAHLRMRPAKAEAHLDVVVAECIERAAGLGFSEEHARGFLGQVSRVVQAGEHEAARELLRQVVAELPEEFPKSALFERAFMEGGRAGFSFGVVNDAVREMLLDKTALEPLGRIGGREQFRRADGFEVLEEFEAGQAAQAGENPEAVHREEDFRSFVSGLIAEEPELDVAEFATPEAVEAELMGDSPLRADMEAEAVAELSAALEEAVAGLRALHGALADESRTTDALRAAVLHRLDQTLPEHEAEFRSVTFDTASPRLAEEARLREEAARLESAWVQETSRAEPKARSLFGQAVERAKEAYSERLVDIAIDRALHRLTEHAAHFTREEFEQAVTGLLAGKRVSLGTRDAGLERALEDPSRVVALGTLEGTEHFTTPEMFRVEAAALRAAEALQVRSDHAERVRELRERLSGLDVPVRNAAARALSGSDFVLIEGTDGRQMQAVQRGLREALCEGLIRRGVDWVLDRKDVLWVAPTATAARELERSVGAENAVSLQKLLHNLDRGLGETVKHHGKMVVHTALGLPTWKANEYELTSRSTVILDSASPADTRQFSRLLTHAERAGARVIACSTHELSGLGPGGLYRELRARSLDGSVTTLTPPEQSRVEVIASRDRNEAKESLVRKWAESALKRPYEHTIVAASARDVHELNQMAQAERKRAGRLGFRSLVVRYKLGNETVKQRVYEGDRIVFTARTGKDVINGVFGTVKHIDLITGRVKVKLDLKEKKYLPWEFTRQKTITFQYRKYFLFRRQEEGFRLGYAATVHRSQNVAVEGNSYTLVGGPDGAPSAVYAGLGLAKGKSYFFGDHLQQRAELHEAKQSAHAIQARADVGPVRREQEQRQSTRHEASQGMSFGL